MNNAFDKVASFYDRLALLVFGAEWKRVQLAPCDHLKGKKNILIVGGGTGQLLEGLGSDNEVVFVELSRKMIEKAKLRKSLAAVDFIHADYLEWRTDQIFDAVVFPFFLDSFSKTSLDKIIEKSRSELKPNGELHVLDFEKSSMLHNLLIKLMFLFFRITTGLESRELLDFRSAILAQDFVMMNECSLYNGWVKYRVYR